jgi:pimeloyl-ACP methyl ester carboxylesterase
MVATIPAVSRAARGHRLVPIAFAHLVGSSMGGAVIGSALGLIGLPLALHVGEKRGLIIGSVALIFALGEFGILKVPRPQRHKQVPAGWRVRFPPEIVAGMYGAILGTGVMTLSGLRRFT